MSTEAAFVNAILDDPDDDTQRLIFADWLEERGNPRSEFLRLQVELGQWVPDVRRRMRLRQREQELQTHYQQEWLGGLGEYCTHWHFARGFAHVTIPAENLALSPFA